jgi:hypothetical protein
VANEQVAGAEAIFINGVIDGRGVGRSVRGLPSGRRPPHVDLEVAVPHAQLVQKRQVLANALF